MCKIVCVILTYNELLLTNSSPRQKIIVCFLLEASIYLDQGTDGRPVMAFTAPLFSDVFVYRKLEIIPDVDSLSGICLLRFQYLFEYNFDSTFIVNMMVKKVYSFFLIIWYRDE